MALSKEIKAKVVRELLADLDGSKSKDLLGMAINFAQNFHDGHFTIMRFTTNWRFKFGSQPFDRDEIQTMPEGFTLTEAIAKALRAELK